VVELESPKKGGKMPKHDHYNQHVRDTDVLIYKIYEFDLARCENSYVFKE
jgi:hypothetical protein